MHVIIVKPFLLYSTTTCLLKYHLIINDTLFSTLSIRVYLHVFVKHHPTGDAVLHCQYAAVLLILYPFSKVGQHCSDRSLLSIAIGFRNTQY